MQQALTLRMQRRVRRSARRHLLLGLVTLAVFLVGGVVAVGEITLRPVVEGRIAAALVEQFGLTREPSVHVRGAPLVLAVAKQRIDGVDLEIVGEQFDGLRVDRIEVRAGRVSFSTADLVRGSGVVRIDEGEGKAVVTEADLTSYLHSQGVPGQFKLTDGVLEASGDISLAGLSTTVSVSGPIVLDGQTLRFTPTAFDLGAFAGVDGAAAAAAAAFGFTAPLPRLEGVRPQRVAVGDGRLDVGAVVDSLAIRY